MASVKEVWNVSEHKKSVYDIIDPRGGIVAGSIQTEPLSENSVFEVVTSGGSTDEYEGLSAFLGGIGGSLLSGKVKDTIGFETYGNKKGIMSISVKSEQG